MLTADRTPPANGFKPFQKGNPGRPKGSRNKLAEKFFTDTYALWSEQGEAVLRRAAFENPLGFAQMIAKLMPAKLEISTPTDGMTDEQLLRMIELAERMAAIGATNARASMTFDRQAVEATGGGGSPHDGLSRGEVIEVIPSSPPSWETEQAPSPAAAPIGDPPDSTLALSLEPTGNPADAEEVDAAAEAEVDPLSLF